MSETLRSITGPQPESQNREETINYLNAGGQAHDTRTIAINRGGDLRPARQDSVDMDMDMDMVEGPSNSAAKIRDLNIREVNRGFIVNVGCHCFAISTTKELLELVTQYINNPTETESKWSKGELMTR